MDNQSDYLMCRKFLLWILRFFGQKFEKYFRPASPKSDESDVGVDLPIIVELLRTAGFRLKYSDHSDLTTGDASCKVIVVCARTGTRVVLEANVKCCCPTENERELVFRPDTNLSQSVSPALLPVIRTSPSLCPAPPTLLRQNTWSRDDERSDVPVQDPRRFSAPPMHSSDKFQPVKGDDFNVMAAKEMIHEALALLDGGEDKAMQNYSQRRVLSEAFLKPSEATTRTAVSRASSFSSGSSLHSSRGSSSSNLGTPRPTRGAAAIRRTVSVMAAVKSKVDSIRNSPGKEAKQKSGPTNAHKSVGQTKVGSRTSASRSAGCGPQSNIHGSKLTPGNGCSRKLINTNKEPETSIN